MRVRRSRSVRIASGLIIVEPHSTCGPQQCSRQLPCACNFVAQGYFSRLAKHEEPRHLLSSLHSSAVAASSQSLKTSIYRDVRQKNIQLRRSNDGFQIRTHDGFSVGARMLMAAAEHANDGLSKRSGPPTLPPANLGRALAGLLRGGLA